MTTMMIVVTNRSIVFRRVSAGFTNASLSVCARVRTKKKVCAQRAAAQLKVSQRGEKKAKVCVVSVCLYNMFLTSFFFFC